LQHDVLLVIAHPDDEIFASGTLCLCSEKGFTIALACMSDGEGGSRELLQPGTSLDRVRRAELRLSALALGIDHEISFFQLPDVANPDRDGKSQWDTGKAVRMLSELILRLKPRLLLTHGPLGGYGHPAHCLTNRCVITAAENVSFDGSIFAFCGQIKGAFFSWQFDQPSDVIIDARTFLRRRTASLSYHHSQISYFLQPAYPRSMRKKLSAIAGYVLAWNEFGRKRVPIVTAARFFEKFRYEGLSIQKSPTDNGPHFFAEHFSSDPRVELIQGK
jgi:LmbE family N-acetylglucosaminyl deacetylase